MLGVLAALVSGCGADTGPSGEDALDVVHACLADRGWDVAVDRESGSLRFSGAPDDADRYEIDAAECADQVPDIMPSAAELADNYRRQVDTVDCLRSHGFRVPAPVSEEAFIAGALGEREPWTAFSRLEVGSKAAWDRAERLCPQPTIGAD